MKARGDRERNRAPGEHLGHEENLVVVNVKGQPVTEEGAAVLAVHLVNKADRVARGSVELGTQTEVREGVRLPGAVPRGHVKCVGHVPQLTVGPSAVRGKIPEGSDSPVRVDLPTHTVGSRLAGLTRGGGKGKHGSGGAKSVCVGENGGEGDGQRSESKADKNGGLQQGRL